MIYRRFTTITAKAFLHSLDTAYMCFTYLQVPSTVEWRTAFNLFDEILSEIDEVGVAAWDHLTAIPERHALGGLFVLLGLKSWYIQMKYLLTTTTVLGKLPSVSGCKA